MSNKNDREKKERKEVTFSYVLRFFHVMSDGIGVGDKERENQKVFSEKSLFLFLPHNLVFGGRIGE